MNAVFHIKHIPMHDLQSNPPPSHSVSPRLKLEKEVSEGLDLSTHPRLNKTQNIFMNYDFLPSSYYIFYIALQKGGEHFTVSRHSVM